MPKSTKWNWNSQSQKAYLKINGIIAGVIVLMLLYSGIFSAGGRVHPIPSMYNVPVVSTGLSRAFSEIVRGNWQQALSYNAYSLQIFIFFVAQLFLRLLFSFLLFRKMFSQNTLLFSDILISVLLFLWAFAAFIVAQFKMIGI
ncbi:MAG: DUF2752 domain-containing protein [Salinivirgaceae bacterium]